MLIGNNFVCGVFDSKKSHKNKKLSALHTVETFQFDYITSCDSCAVSYINEKSCKLTPNMLIIRKPGQKSQSKLHYKCYCLHLEIAPDTLLFDELYNTPEYFTLINESIYRHLFEELLQHVTKNGKNPSDFFINAKILELAYHIKKDKKYNTEIKRYSLKKENASVRKAITYIKENYQKNITLSELGDITGYSPNHFQRLFIQTIGISPSKYLEKVRINQAKYLLIENEKSLSEIAYECGFSSQSYFSKVFKRHTLLSPYDFQSTQIFRFKGSSDFD